MVCFGYCAAIMTLPKAAQEIRTQLPQNIFAEDNTIVRTPDVRLFRAAAENKRYNAALLDNSRKRRGEWDETFVNLWHEAATPIEANVGVNFSVAPDGSVTFDPKSRSSILEKVREPASVESLLSDMAREFYSASGINNISAHVINQPRSSVEIKRRPLMISSIISNCVRWTQNDPSRDVFLPRGDWMYVGPDSHMKNLEFFTVGSQEDNVSMAVILTGQDREYAP